MPHSLEILTKTLHKRFREEFSSYKISAAQNKTGSEDESAEIKPDEIDTSAKRPLDTHSAMSRYPQEAAAWRGIQPSLSGWLMQAPCSTRKVTMSTLSSMHA